MKDDKTIVGTNISDETVNDFKHEISKNTSPTISFLSIEGIDKNIRKLKAENKVIRIGSDKGGHWEIVK